MSKKTHNPIHKSHIAVIAIFSCFIFILFVAQNMDVSITGNAVFEASNLEGSEVLGWLVFVSVYGMIIGAYFNHKHSKKYKVKSNKKSKRKKN